MKSLFYKLYIFSFAALMLVSCQKDETLTIATTGTPGTVSATSANLVLTKADAAKTAITISWTKTDYGYNAAVKNILELSLKGNNFATKQEIIADANTLEKSFTVIDFNALMLKMGLPTGINSIIDVRVKSTIADSIAPIYSNVLNITVNPYPLTSFLYVPGAYQGWNPATADSLLSATSNGIYKGVINYTAGNLGFKILTQKSWGPPEYGKGSADGTIAVGGGDLSAPAAGSYELVADINANTLVFSPLVWGVIGNAPVGSNWSNDIDMKYDNGKQTWSATVDMGVGAFKFRKNHDWAVNFGYATVGTLGGTDIPVTEAGNYKVVLDLINNKYTLTKL
ncbi:MAG: hypothetical protein JWN56_2363 [Sphingobacteriales bacterium]|nr:hypothetical protein [Sphingobacteriales bacterium]